MPNELSKERIEEVFSDFNNRKTALKNIAQTLLKGSGVDATIIDIEIGGSYANGTATENSDIDLNIKYSGTASNENIWFILWDALYGKFGMYDIVPQKIQD